MYFNYLLLLCLLSFSYGVKIFSSLSDIASGSTYIRDKRSVVLEQKKRWRFPLRYYIDKGVNRSVVEEALRRFEKHTCLKFKKIRHLTTTKQVLHFQKFHVCGTFIGNYFGEKAQMLGVDSYCNQCVGAMQYLIGYTLGMVNQQSRCDRDKYVNVYMENVLETDVIGFKKYGKTEAENYNIGYDFGSIFQYGTKEFSKNGNFTVFPKIPLYRYMMGQRIGFSFNDYKLLNMHYCRKKMDRSAGRRLKCRNSGYPNPIKRGVCVCPNGFTGRECNRIETDINKCKKTRYLARPKRQTLKLQGKKNCTFIIEAPKGRRVHLTVLRAVTHKERPCLQDSGLEIKHYKDKGSTGLCVCGMFKDFDLDSDDNKVMVIYKGTSKSDLITLKYRSFYKR
uniref:Metalloendopeptidase n=1 Tax=Parastrongyloides trichosuri TaxID=131310 RepID=A0A0N4ZM58_PARTI